MNKLICSENLLNMQDIIDKVNELGVCCDEVTTCCDNMDAGDVIRTLLVGDKLFLTNDGTAPTEVATNGSDPIETYMNSIEMEQIIFMGINLREMYMNDILVFKGVLELVLPQYQTTIDLMAFISSHDLKGFKIIEVTNNLIQPAIISGDTTGLEVSLSNVGGDFQGLSSSGDAMTLTSPLFLDNTNGWIRGAGGSGGDGGGYDSSNIPSKVGNWLGRGTYDDGGPYISGQISPLWCNVPICGYHAYYNRFWKEVNSPVSGAWVMSGGAAGQEYWNTQSRAAGQAPIWGDQGPCHFNTSGFWCRNSGGLQIAAFSSTTVIGGSIGIGGAGQGFGVAANAGQTDGIDGSYTGPSSGFDSNGNNLSLPTPGSFINGDGGVGGTWAVAGTAGTNSGDAGQPAGNAIVGSAFLVAGSITGNVNGAII